MSLFCLSGKCWNLFDGMDHDAELMKLLRFLCGLNGWVCYFWIILVDIVFQDFFHVSSHDFEWVVMQNGVI